MRKASSQVNGRRDSAGDTSTGPLTPGADDQAFDLSGISDPIVDIGVAGSTPDKLRALQERADRIIENIESNQRSKPGFGRSLSGRQVEVLAGDLSSPSFARQSRRSGQTPLGSVPAPPTDLIRANSGAASARAAREETSSSAGSRYSEDFEEGPSSRDSMPAEPRRRDDTFDENEFTMVNAPSSADADSAQTPTAGQNSSTAGGVGKAASAAVEETPSKEPTSQKLRRPPPGRIMSAAEMDASDDEYEPGESPTDKGSFASAAKLIRFFTLTGWANIITTRKQ